MEAPGSIASEIALFVSVCTGTKILSLRSIPVVTCQLLLVIYSWDREH